MKKAITIILILSISLLFLTGCDSSSVETATTQQQAGNEDLPKPPELPKESLPQPPALPEE